MATAQRQQLADALQLMQDEFQQNSETRERLTRQLRDFAQGSDARTLAEVVGTIARYEQEEEQCRNQLRDKMSTALPLQLISLQLQESLSSSDPRRYGADGLGGFPRLSAAALAEVPKTSFSNRNTYKPCAIYPMGATTWRNTAWKPGKARTTRDQRAARTSSGTPIYRAMSGANWLKCANASSCLAGLCAPWPRRSKS